MTRSDYFIIGLAVVSITFLAWNWRREGIARALAEQEALILADSIKVAEANLEKLYSQFENDRTQFGKDTLRLHQLLQSARVTIRHLRNEGDSLEGVLDTLATPGDSVALLRQIADTRLQEAQTCGVALDSTTGLYNGCTGLLARSDTLLDRERGIRRQNEALAELYRRQAHPSLFQKIGRGLPWLAAGVVVGAVLVR